MANQVEVLWKDGELIKQMLASSTTKIRAFGEELQRESKIERIVEDAKESGIVVQLIDALKYETEEKA